MVFVSIVRNIISACTYDRLLDTVQYTHVATLPSHAVCNTIPNGKRVKINTIIVQRLYYIYIVCALCSVGNRRTIKTRKIKYLSYYPKIPCVNGGVVEDDFTPASFPHHIKYKCVRLTCVLCA